MKLNHNLEQALLQDRKEIYKKLILILAGRNLLLVNNLSSKISKLLVINKNLIRRSCKI